MLRTYRQVVIDKKQPLLFPTYPWLKQSLPGPRLAPGPDGRGLPEGSALPRPRDALATSRAEPGRVTHTHTHTREFDFVRRATRVTHSMPELPGVRFTMQEAPRPSPDSSIHFSRKRIVLVALRQRCRSPAMRGLSELVVSCGFRQAPVSLPRAHPPGLDGGCHLPRLADGGRRVVAAGAMRVPQSGARDRGRPVPPARGAGLGPAPRRLSHRTDAGAEPYGRGVGLGGSGPAVVRPVPRPHRAVRPIASGKALAMEMSRAAVRCPQERRRGHVPANGRRSPPWRRLTCWHAAATPSPSSMPPRGTTIGCSLHNVARRAGRAGQAIPRGGAVFVARIRATSHRFSAVSDAFALLADGAPARPRRGGGRQA